jgi:hypothetical protein
MRVRLIGSGAAMLLLAVYAVAIADDGNATVQPVTPARGK